MISQEALRLDMIWKIEKTRDRVLGKDEDTHLIAFNIRIVYRLSMFVVSFARCNARLCFSTPNKNLELKQ